MISELRLASSYMEEPSLRDFAISKVRDSRIPRGKCVGVVKPNVLALSKWAAGH